MGMIPGLASRLALLASTSTVSVNGTSYFVTEVSGLRPDQITWSAWFELFVSNGIIDADIEHSSNGTLWDVLVSAAALTSTMGTSGSMLVVAITGNFGPYVRARSVASGAPAVVTANVWLCCDAASVGIVAA